MLGAEQAGLLGAGGRVAYLLKTDFPSATGTPITLTNGVTYTDAETWIDDGTLTVVDTSTGTVKVNSKKMEVTGVITFNTTGQYSNAIEVLDGRVFKISTTLKSPMVDTLINLDDATGISTTLYVCNVYLHAANGIYVQLNDGASSTLVYGTPLTGGSTYEIAFVTDKTNSKFYIYIKGGTEFATFTLIDTASQSPGTTLYLSEQHSTGLNYVEYEVVQETLYPELMDTVTYSAAERAAILDGIL